MLLKERCPCGSAWEVNYINAKQTENMETARADREEWRELHAAHIVKSFDQRQRNLNMNHSESNALIGAGVVTVEEE